MELDSDGVGGGEGGGGGGAAVALTAGAITDLQVVLIIRTPSHIHIVFIGVTQSCTYTQPKSVSVVKLDIWLVNLI